MDTYLERFSPMKPETVLRTGVVLLLMGLTGLGIALTDLASSYNAMAVPSAAAIAESVSISIVPAAIGAPLILVGLIFLFVSWWNSPRHKRSTAHSDA